MINPWIWWIINDPEGIPDLNPKDNEEARDCLFSFIGFCIASVIFISLDIITAMLVLKYDFSMFILPIGMLINTIIYVALIILFINIAFKISSKLSKTNKE